MKNIVYWHDGINDLPPVDTSDEYKAKFGISKTILTYSREWGMRFGEYYHKNGVWSINGLESCNDTKVEKWTEIDPNEDQQPATDQYEYGISYFDDYPCEENRYDFDLIKTLNDFGKNGWEVFSLTQEAPNTSTTIYYTAQMKRKITNQ
jgi:hypothetical protein